MNCSNETSNTGFTGCQPDVNLLPVVKLPYEFRKTMVHEGNMATKLTIYVEVWFRAGKQKKIRGKLKRQKYAGHIMCLKDDVDTAEKLKVVTDHMFKQICDKYKITL